MKTRTQQGFTLIELLVVITIIAILASLAVPTFAKIQEKGNQTKGISNCRQIITAMRIFASENSGNYPGSSAASGNAGSTTDSNTAFQELFTGGVLKVRKGGIKGAAQKAIGGRAARGKGNPQA